MPVFDESMPRFWNSLLFKVPITFLGLLLFVIAFLFAVLSGASRELLKEETYEKIRLTGSNIVSTLDRQLTYTETLAINMAKLAEELPPDSILHKKLFPALIGHVGDHENAKDLIAGGGIWPEPFLFEKNTRRRSFFWGRNHQEIPKYFDDYNNPEGPGYHNEEWYVPVRYIRADSVFWSKSYVDPYSKQPMVTVSAPMYRNDAFYGVSTIDLKLSGLKSFLEKSAKPLQGYAFAMDRNGKFLSFPDEQLARERQDFVYLEQLAAKIPAFEKISAAIKRHSLDGMTGERLLLAKKIATESYQINLEEAKTIAHIIASQNEPGTELAPQQIILESDYFLKQPALASIITMPETFWKIVLVVPLNVIEKDIQKLYAKLAIATLICVVLAGILILLFLKYVFIRPLSQLNVQLKTLSASGNENVFLKGVDKDEIGHLVSLFNQRSQKLMETRQELISNIERLKRSQAFAQIGSWEWNIKTNELFWTEQIPVLLGLSSGEIKVSYENFIHAVHPEDREEVENAINRCLEQGIKYEVEHRIAYPDGSIRWLLEQGNVIRNDKNQPETMLGIVQDVTWRHEAQQQLVEAKLQAEKANQAKSEFLAQMSHELRTPLNAIMGFAQLLELEEETLAPEQLDFVQEIYKSGQNLLALINNILYFMDLDEGEFEACFENLCLHSVVKKELLDIAEAFPDTSIKIDNQLPKRGPLVHADKNLLHQVLQNLISNAIKYNRPDGTVTISATQTDDTLRLSVTDTGNGLTEEEMEMIFRPFERLSAKNGTIQGSGIGLNLCKQLMRLMKGEIGVESVPGRGSTFWIDLQISGDRDRYSNVTSD